MIFITNSVPYIVVALFLYLWFGSKKTDTLENQHIALHALFAAIIDPIFEFMFWLYAKAAAPFPLLRRYSSKRLNEHN
nr:hypothetical protein [Ectobacillus panaciterrae]